MATDPAVTGKEAIRALVRLGFLLDRVEGSHHMLVKPGHPRAVVVPVHGSQALPRDSGKYHSHSAGNQEAVLHRARMTWQANGP